MLKPDERIQSIVVVVVVVVVVDPVEYHFRVTHLRHHRSRFPGNAICKNTNRMYSPVIATC